MIQRAYRLRYEALQRRREAELARLAREREKAERLRIEGGMWWSKKIAAIPVPDHGKLYGNATIDSVKGWGSWVGTTWVPAPDDTRPAEQRYEFRDATRHVLAARGLHFRNDDMVMARRAQLLKDLRDNGIDGAGPNKDPATG